MNRTGLLIALAVAAVVGVIFGLRPDLDLKLAGLFFDPERGGFWRSYNPPYLRARDAATWLITLVAMPAVVALVIKLVRPDAWDDDLERRLEREAQAMAQLSHPNVVQIFDIGRHGDHAGAPSAPRSPALVAVEHPRHYAVQHARAGSCRRLRSA